MLASRASVLPSRWLRDWGRWLGIATVALIGLLALGARRLGRPGTRAESAGPAPAFGATTRAGHPVRWTRSEIVLELFDGESKAFSNAELRTALEDGARAWNAALAACSAPKLRVASAPSPVGRVRQDSRSVVRVQSRAWCPDEARDREQCYDARRAAITHLYPVQTPSGPHDGELEEADIELDAVDYRWSLDGDQPGTHSLRAIVAHELGHVLGLEHACASLEPAHGLKRPACSAPEAMASIMYPEPVEDGRRLVLAPGRAEVTTVCALYPSVERSWF